MVTFAFRTVCRDLVTDGKTGLIVPQDDVGLRELMADPERRVAMGAAGCAVIDCSVCDRSNSSLTEQMVANWS